MLKPLRVLMVEDSEDDAVLITRELKRGGYEPVTKRVDTAQDMRDSLAQEKWDVVISDYVMPKFDGLSAFKILRETKQDLPFIVVSGSIGEDIAVDAMKAGVHDYIMKGNLSRLPTAIGREIREAGIRSDRKIDSIIIDELASYPRRYPNPIVEVERSGAIHYMNPRAKSMFPDLGKKGFSHPFLAEIDVIWETLKQSEDNAHDREILIDGIYYQQIMYYVDNRDNVRIYAVDISKRKKAEDDLKRAYEQLRDTQFQLVQTSKMAALGMLTSTIAHEISNPLMSVLNNLQMLKADLSGTQSQSPEVQGFINSIEESANRCKAIIQSFLSFSRSSQGKFQLLSLNKLIESMMGLLAREFYHDNIKVDKKLGSGLPDIFADAQLIQQVIFDLAVNAKIAVMKKKPDGGGYIRVDTEFDAESRQVVLKISDNGIGIAQDNLEKIFTPYFTTNFPDGGTGLGLAIAADILKAHKASIKAQSPKEGAVFTVRFPVPEVLPAAGDTPDNAGIKK